jgi:hypothetical protein
MPKKDSHRKGSATRITARKASAARAAGSARTSGSTRAKRVRARREAQELVENISPPPKKRERRGPNSKASANAVAKESKSKVRSRPER